MDQQGDAQEDPIMNDSAPELESENEDSALDKDGDECMAAKSDDEIVDETVSPSLMMNQTKSKARKVVRPEALMCSDTEDEISRPLPHKRNHAGPAPLRAVGTSKYFRRNSNQFPRIAKSLQPARGDPAVADESDQFKECAPGEEDSNLTTTLNFFISSH